MHALQQTQEGSSGISQNHTTKLELHKVTYTQAMKQEGKEDVGRQAPAVGGGWPTLFCSYLYRIFKVSMALIIDCMAVKIFWYTSLVKPFLSSSE